MEEVSGMNNGINRGKGCKVVGCVRMARCRGFCMNCYQKFVYNHKLKHMGSDNNG